MNLKLRSHGLAIAVIGAAAAVLLTPGAAFAQAGPASTDVDISMPDIVILHYFSNVDITIDSAALTAFLGYGTDTVDAGTGAGTGFTVDLDIASTAGFDPTGDPSAADLILQNAWAVRSIHLGGGAVQTRVSIATTDNTLSHAGGGGEAITIGGEDVRVGAGAWGANVSFNPPGIVNPQLGDVRLTLDLTNATLAGAYNDGVFTLTAENI